jgi:muconate cycloisomerase
VSATAAACTPIRVRDLHAVPVRVARRPELLPKTAHGEVAYSEYVLLELRTEDGVVGLGEVTCAPGWNGEEWAGSALLVRDRIGELLRGADLRAWGAIGAGIDRAVRGRPFLRAGIEMACLDALGKTLGVPVTTLLGGALRDDVPTKIVLPARDTAFVRTAAADVLQRGARALKVKVGVGVAGDVRRVAAARELAGDGLPITVDANEGWSTEEAGRAVAALQALGVEAFEQPVARGALGAMADLRRRTGALVVADESVWTQPDVLRGATAGAFDVVSVYPGKCGGMQEAVALARVAAGLGLTVSYGSNLELGVGTAALVHAAAASPALSAAVPSDAIGPLYFASSLVADDGFVRWDGAAVPDAPGLGVELDPAAVAAHRIDGAA